MSIHYVFTMMPKKKLFKKQEPINFNQTVAALRSWEKEEQIRIEIKGKEIKITYCPEGYFWITYRPDSNKLTGDCQTNVAGPGFHAASMRLIERLSERLDYKLVVEDDTGYFTHKDFERMKKEHFYPWLRYILTLLCEQYTKTDFQICWDLDSYVPMTIPGTVVTPIRRFTINEIKLFYNKEIELFANEFFVWNELKKDARFYRNSALMKMNTACYFAFSERSIWDGIENGLCLQMLEQALKYDVDLPFPKKEYLLLCKLHDQEPVNLEGVPELEHECEIGYRRQEVYHHVGQFTYSVYGSCLQKYDHENHTMFYYDDEPGRWHNIRVTSITFPDKDADFVQNLFKKGHVEKTMEFLVGEGICKLAIYEKEPLANSPEGFCYEITAQMILDRQLLLVSQTFCREDEQEKIIDWFKRIEGKRRTSFRQETHVVGE